MNVNKNVAKRVQRTNALASSASQTVAIQEGAKLCAQLGLNIEDANFDYDVNWNGVQLVLQFKNCNYDVLMQDVNTIISDTTTICCRKSKEFELVTHNCKLTVILTATCALPEEDLAVLYMLGKVKTRIANATPYTTIICEV